MAKRIKLMADYQCWPLWWGDDRKIGNINPSTLPLQPTTIARLEKWAQLYDSQLDLGDPLSSKFFDASELEDFEKEGFDLWVQLRKELYPEYEVWYFSQTLGLLLENPDDNEDLRIYYQEITD